MTNLINLKNGEMAVQGDVSLLSAMIPESIELKPLKEKTVNIGESAHHHHIVVADKDSECLFSEETDGKTYVRVLKGTATLHHLAMPSRTKADHDPIAVPVGDYVFGKQYEYDELGDRQVID